MSMVANKFPNVRAALCNDLFSAKMSRLHNDANILVMGGRVIGKDLAAEIVKVWLSTPFEGDRHLNRLIKIKKIEEKLNTHGTEVLKKTDPKVYEAIQREKEQRA